MTQLTKNFQLEEFLVSQTAVRNDIDMTPSQIIIDNLTALCVTVLQPLRNSIDSPIRISSGYRPLKLNRLIGSHDLSAHVDGRAADFTVVGQDPRETAELMLELDLIFDQLILEFHRWIHAAISITPRQQVLTAYRQHGVAQYSSGLRDA